VFVQLLEPCFVVVPTKRVSFAALCKILQTLVDGESKRLETSAGETMSSATDLFSSEQGEQSEFPSAALSVASYGSAHVLDTQGYVDGTEAHLQETAFRMHSNPIHGQSTNSKFQTRTPSTSVLQLTNGYVMSEDVGNFASHVPSLDGREETSTT
jgi:hypothetical protein